jgi:hypothetical protein
MSDSLMLEVTGEGKERLIKAIELSGVKYSTGIEQRGNDLVIFYNSSDSTGKKLPINPVLFVDAIIEWLGRGKSVNSYYAFPDYGPEPDIDGHCKKGWKLTYSDLAARGEIKISPQWMIYHK